MFAGRTQTLEAVFQGLTAGCFTIDDSLIVLDGDCIELGHTVSRSTVRRILKERGMDPAPERSKRMPWNTFLKAYWEAIAAADFLTVPSRS